VRGYVGCGVPFYAAYVGRGGDGGAGSGEVARGVCRFQRGGTLAGGRGGGIESSGRGCLFGKRHDVEVVQEDPEDFARDVGDFAAPEAVRAGRAHVEDEVDGAVG